MRLMLTFRIPSEEGNAALKDARFTPTLQSIVEELQPEAAYFGPIEGARGGYFVVNMDDAPEFCAYAEPLFLALGATVQIHPVFTPDDMPRVAEIMEQATQRYG